jgi:hypothetical protein
VIDGKYMIRIADNGRFDEQLAVANYLIDKARQDRAGAKPGR